MTNASARVHQELSDARLSRLKFFVLCGGVGWAFFALKNYVISCPEIGWFCLMGAVFSVVMYGLTRGSADKKRIVAAVYLFLNMILISTIAVLTGQSQSCSTIFLCCIGVFASHIVGIRAALVWSILCSAALVIINHGFIIGDVTPVLVYSPIERTFHYIATIAILLFFCWQAQHYYNLQTSNLVQLSESLEDKAEAFEHLAKFDSLTGLRNRRSFQAMLGEAVNQCSASDSRFLLLLLDLNGFKAINDTRGHHAGDQILQAVADRLNEIAGDGNHVSRLGGDEFTILIRNADWLELGWNDELMRQNIESLAADLVKPFSVNDNEYVIDVSTGAAKFPDDSQTPGELLSFADTAMYEAKRNQDRLRLYDPELTKTLIRRRTLESRLGEALARDEFRVFYQPQVDVGTGRIIGAEALLRWEHDGTWIGPNEFIPLLESSREILRVGHWVLSQACQHARSWNQRGHDLNVSVNVSSIQFQEAGFLDLVFDALQASGIDPQRLDLEITESLLIHDVPQATKVLDQLRELGISISIDDFGTGYSSLSYLRDLPLTRLKIDRSFISNIGSSNDDGVIAQTIINLAHNIGTSVLAEGVEEIEQLQFLQQHACDYYQGFYFSRPLPEPEFVKLLDQRYMPSNFDVNTDVSASQID